MGSEEGTILKLLVIDDDLQIQELIRAALSQEGLEILTATDPETGLELFRRARPRMLLVDLMMPQSSGIEVLQQVLAEDPGAEVILMTGHYSTESAVEAIQKGASDYLPKPLELKRLRERVADSLAEARRRRRAIQLDHQLLDTFQFEGMIGRSPLMLDVFVKIRRVAPHFRTVLVTGATGTGKELVARALHRLSPVSAGPFAVCNCSALVETLTESELFGYVRGAFTGATQDKVGLFEYASGGTVFLDEIGEMPLASQAKLLRVLQNQEVQRVGSPAVRKVDVRLVAATNRNLRQLAEEEQFRRDLYYRLSMVEIALPPLADRREDQPLLQRHFVEKFAQQYGKPIEGITRRAQAVLGRYPWPGNVRELENVIGNACMMAEEPIIDVKDLAPQVLARQEAMPATEPQELLSFEQLQMRHLARVLEAVGGDKKKAAEILGVSRTTLYNLLAKKEAGKDKEPRSG